MKVKILKDKDCFRKGQVLELHPYNISNKMKYYIEYNIDYGFVPAHWGFADLDEIMMLDWIELIDEDVKHDAHYKACTIEPWEIMEKNFTKEEFIGFLKGNIVKYILREKGQDLEDCDKIANYAQKLKEVLQKDIGQE